MADKKVFTLEIDGVKQSYNEVVKLHDILNKIKDVHAKVTVETEKVSKATENSAKISKEKTKALTDEEEAQKKLADTQAKAFKPISDLEKEQAKANLQLKERARQLTILAKLELAAKNSPAEIKAELAKLNEEWNNVDMGSEAFANLTERIEALNTKLKGSEFAKGTFGRNVGNYPQLLGETTASFEKLGDGVHRTTEDAKGMLSAFQSGVGIALLFDDSNTELEKTLNAVGKIMAIIGALQQANNLLLIKGAVASKVSATMEGIHAIQIRARATAIALSAKNTVAATIAQTAFNVVAKANPYVLLAVALITVIGALSAFVIGTNDSIEKQKLMNEVILDSIQLREQYISTMKKLTDSNINELQRELDLMKTRGASEAQIAQKQRQIYEERLKYAKLNSANNKKYIDDINKNAEKVKFYSLEIEKLNKGLLDGTYKNNEAFKEKKETLEQYLQVYTQYLNIGLQAQEEEKNVVNDLDKFNAETAKKGIELGKKNALALAEYRVLMAQKGSKDELIAQIAAANQRLKNDLDNVDITNGERLKRTRETLLGIEKLESDYRKAQAQDSIDLVDARLSLSKKGSLEEYNLNISRLDEQKEIDLDNKNLTDNQKLRIENKYLSDVKKLTDDYAKAISENEINTSISTINARLASVKVGTQEELNSRIDLANENARLAKENIENTIQDETLKAAKIKEINENLQKDIKGLTSANELSTIESQANKETLLLTQQLEKRKISKLDYESQMRNISIASLEEEIAVRKKYGQDTTALEAELSNARIDQAESEKNKVVEHFKQMHETLQKYVDGVMTGVNAIFDATNSVLQAQLDEANEKYDAISKKYDEVVEKREESDDKLQDLEEQAKNARGGRALILQEQINAEMVANQQLANQEKQLAKEKEKQEQEIAKKEKQMKRVELTQNIVQGVANTALGVTKALEWGFPLGSIFAAIIGAMGAVQVGVMASQLAKLEDGGLLNGKRHSNGGMRIEGTNIEVEGGEYVVNRESTDKNIGLVKYINSQRRALGPNDLSSFFSKSAQSFEPPFKKMFESGGQLPAIENTVSIDNDALVNAIRGIRIEPKVSVTDINDAQNDAVKVDSWTGL
jgi:hypothetical protein